MGAAIYECLAASCRLILRCGKVTAAMGCVVRKALGVFGERLGGYAESLHGEVAGFEGGLGDLEKFHGVSDLELIAGAIEAHKSGDATDFGFGWFGWFGLGGGGKEKEE